MIDRDESKIFEALQESLSMTENMRQLTINGDWISSNVSVEEKKVDL